MKRILVYLSVFLFCFIHLKAEEKGLQWSNIAPQFEMNLQEAIDYCNNLNEGGYSDWRLPNIDELSTKLFNFCFKGMSNECKVSELNNCLSSTCSKTQISSFKEFKMDENFFQTSKCFCREDMELYSEEDFYDKLYKANYFTYPTLYKLGIDINLFIYHNQQSQEDLEKLGKFGITQEILQKRETNRSSLSPEEIEKSSILMKTKWWSSSPVSDIPNRNWIVTNTGIEISDTNTIPLSPMGPLRCVRGKNLCENNHSCAKIKNSTGICIKAAINDFSCECKQGFFWNGKECVTPCSTNTCQSVSHSTSSCIPISATEYSCECEKGYFWNGKTCVDPCDKNICSSPSLTHSNSSCISISATEYSCECKKGFAWNGKHCTSALLGTICTGQTKCYDNNKEIPCPTSPKDEFFGQDAQYTKKKKCKPQSFQIKTVSNQNIVIDKNTGLIWQQTIPTEQYTSESAINYCENLTYAGYSDWRLPTPEELLTIVDNGKDPAIDTTYFPGNHAWFWSHDGSDSNRCTLVTLSSGAIDMNYFAQEKFPVRCVR